MHARVRSLGYAVLGCADLDRWRAFGTDVLGLQLLEHGDGSIRFRTDEYLWRLQIDENANPGVHTIGWEVAGPEDLAELALALEGAGYDVERPGAEGARARNVTELVRFADPDGAIHLELFYGLTNALTKFLSPTGTTFVSGRRMGLGHVFQLVGRPAEYASLYEQILGFRLSDHIETPGGAEATFYHCNPRHHSFAYVPVDGDDRGRSRGVGHIMLECADIDGVGRAIDAMQAGGTKMTATLGRHTNDKMVSFYMESPSGTGIEYGTGGIEIDDSYWTPTRYQSAHYWGHAR